MITRFQSECITEKEADCEGWGRCIIIASGSVPCVPLVHGWECHHLKRVKGAAH